ncbi:MAG: M48 family metallopeptidase [Thermoplasmatota archaeon]
MITDRQHIVVGGVAIDVLRKDIKHLHLGVYPPQGRVRVSAPSMLSDDAVRLAVVERLTWIRRQQDRFYQQERQSPRQAVTGETHYFHGKRFRLRLIEADGPMHVRVAGQGTIEMHAPAHASPGQRLGALDQWYRQDLRSRIPALITAWEPKVGVKVADWRIKRMRTRWGTCNQQARRIWLNSELAKKPPHCLDYIVVHEMLHIHERHHNRRFQDSMDMLLPRWRIWRQELNREPLGHETWLY